MLLWVFIGLLALLAAVLALRLHLLHRDLDELGRSFAARLGEDTNVGLDTRSTDRHVQALAAALDRQLKRLRQEHLRYVQGDRELKAAVTNISHDLRTPLTAICGYLELLRREELSPDAARYLALIENRTLALKQLTEELFRYSVLLSGQEEPVLERVCLNSALEESIAGFYAALTQRGITPEIQIPEQAVFRPLNRDALSRVLGNILSNALKYSDGDLEILLQSSGEITFSNTAAKLDEVQVGRLFDRFYSVEAARNSTGLGLSIAKLLTEQMHGEIWAEYAPPKLRIHVRFPAP